MDPDHKLRLGPVGKVTYRHRQPARHSRAEKLAPEREAVADPVGAQERDGPPGIEPKLRPGILRTLALTHLPQPVEPTPGRSPAPGAVESLDRLGFCFGEGIVLAR